jgi:BirA family biotin operon repressor/biotin-[acetyl-CoA-carboxylase] ligase
VLGIGVKVAVDVGELPEELREKAGSLGRPRAEVEPFLSSLLAALERAFALPADELLGAWRARDALLGSEISWATGTGIARGIDGEGRLVVELAGGGRTALNAGEVHLGRLPAA